MDPEALAWAGADLDAKLHQLFHRSSASRACANGLGGSGAEPSANAPAAPRGATTPMQPCRVIDDLSSAARRSPRHSAPVRAAGSSRSPTIRTCRARQGCVGLALQPGTKPILSTSRLVTATGVRPRSSRRRRCWRS